MLKHTRGGVGPSVYEHCMDLLASDGAPGNQFLEDPLGIGGVAEEKGAYLRNLLLGHCVTGLVLSLVLECTLPSDI